MMSEPNQTDLLVTRIVGRDDRPDDWDRLRDEARADPTVWTRLADELEDDMLVRTAISQRGCPAATVALPRARLFRLPRQAGWVAALLVAALWIGGVPMPWRPGGTREPSPPTEVVQVESAVELGELPRVVFSTSPVAEDGSVEVVYLRRVLERKRVQDLQTLGVDELGLPFSAPHAVASIAVPRSM